MSYGLIRTECDIFVRRVDSAGGIYRWDAAKNTGDAGLYRHHCAEHPRAVRLRRGLKRRSHQPQKDGSVDRSVSGHAERHRRSAGVQSRERTFWVRVMADKTIPAIQAGIYKFKLTYFSLLHIPANMFRGAALFPMRKFHHYLYLL